MLWGSLTSQVPARQAVLRRRHQCASVTNNEPAQGELHLDRARGQAADEGSAGERKQDKERQ